MARVFLTNDGKAYMVTVQNEKKRFFKVDASLLELGELGFFEKVMKTAREIPIETAIKMKFETDRDGTR